MPKRIESVEQLKKESLDGAEFFIVLCHNLISRKYVRWDEDEGKFEIINWVDDSEQMLTEEEIMESGITNIGKAIRKKAFYKDCD